MVDYREEIRIGKEILARVVEAYRKLRNTLRYLAANLYDFDPAARRAAGGRAGGGGPLRAGAVRRGGDSGCARRTTRYEFPAVFQAVNTLATVDLSRVLLRRLEGPDVHLRRGGRTAAGPAQTAMYLIADGLVRLVAPLLPVTADELWRALPGPAGGRPCTWWSSRRRSTRCWTRRLVDRGSG